MVCNVLHNTVIVFVFVGVCMALVCNLAGVFECVHVFICMCVFVNVYVCV